MTGRRVVLAAAAAALATTGCWQAGKYAVQHTIGARLGPCDASKDSVAAARGAPNRRYSSDEEDVTTGAQVF